MDTADVTIMSIKTDDKRYLCCCFATNAQKITTNNNFGINF